MKTQSLILALSLFAGLFAGCATTAPRRVYKEAQFESRLEYLRFCQTHEMRTGRCE
jgi:hypothetical protein